MRVSSYYEVGAEYRTLSSSSGPGALSIWTHNIRGVDFDLNDSRVFNGAVGTAKVAAGMTVAEALSAAAEQNLTLITGSDSTVGVMGWLSGGGHGAITSRYGLGADNVVEMEVVTPQGELLTLNADSYPDLFWAVRGVSAAYRVPLPAY